MKSLPFYKNEIMTTESVAGARDECIVYELHPFSFSAGTAGTDNPGGLIRIVGENRLLAIKIIRACGRIRGLFRRIRGGYL